MVIAPLKCHSLVYLEDGRCAGTEVANKAVYWKGCLFTFINYSYIGGDFDKTSESWMASAIGQ